jgi:hypothetical protein
MKFLQVNAHLYQCMVGNFSFHQHLLGHSVCIQPCLTIQNTSLVGSSPSDQIYYLLHQRYTQLWFILQKLQFFNFHQI